VIIFVIGTTAEAIKVAPLINLMSHKQISYRIISTEQHPAKVMTTLESLECEIPYFLTINASTSGLTKMSQVPFWFASSLFHLYRILREESPSTVIVHGDTLTTLIASLASRLSSKTVVHLEAGYRSGVWFSPFPEEILRRLVSKLSDYHLAPGSSEVSNLVAMGIDNKVISNTRGNTGIDNVLKMLPRYSKSPNETTEILVTLHRTENLQNRSWINQTVRELSMLSDTCRIRFVTDNRSFKIFSETQLIEKTNVFFYEKQSYPSFLNLIFNSDCVITDSGGLQQECAVIGVPTLVHRRISESKDGIGLNIMLSRNAAGALTKFISQIDRLRHNPDLGIVSPSFLAIQALDGWGLLNDE
jgi:UDP-N-acetylglucosamine 2-epimerase (non-hydrolysing)